MTTFRHTAVAPPTGMAAIMTAGVDGSPDVEHRSRQDTGRTSTLPRLACSQAPVARMKPTRALAVDPEDPDRWYVSASPGPRNAHSESHAQAYVYRWRGAGPWEALGGPLSQPLASMPYVLHSSGRRLYAGLKNGQLHVSDDAGDTWSALPLRGASLSGLTALVSVERA